MNTLDIIRDLCDKNNTSIKALEKELGYSNGSLAKAKTIPSDRILDISRKFGVSMEYLMTGKEEPEQKEPALTPKDERDIAKDLENIMQKLKRGEDGPASFEGTDIPEDDLELFAGQVELMLRRLKAINKEKYNPHKNKK